MVFIKQQISETESKEMILDSYVTHIHTHTCSACGGKERFSQIFEVWCHPTKTRSTRLTSLRPVVGLDLKPLNMAIVPVPAKQIPICCSCASSYRVVGKPELVTVQSSNDRWQETLHRKYAEPPKPAQPAAPAKIIPSLDQL
jgi:hypothetical protein